MLRSNSDPVKAFLSFRATRQIDKTHRQKDGQTDRHTGILNSCANEHQY